MPLYEFVCRQCFARLHRIQAPHAPAPKCCGRPMCSELHPPALRFVGPGFHINDYGRKAEK